MTTVRARGPLVNWQEIDEADPGDEHGDIDDLFRPRPGHRPARETLERSFHRGYSNVGMVTAVPISVPGPLDVERHTITQTCPGRNKADAHRAGTAPTPRRVCVRAFIACPALPFFPGFVDENGHYPFKVPDLWEECHASWRRITHGTAADDWTITTGRDTNHHGPMSRLVPGRERVLIGAAGGIDKVTAIEGLGKRHLRIEVEDRRDVNLTIDGHNARGVLLAMTDRNGDTLVVWVVTANVGRKAGPAETRANIALVRRGFR